MQPRSAVAPAPIEPTAGAGAPEDRVLGGRTESDHARLQAMFDAHHDLVWRTLRRYGLDPETAADVGQHAYLVAVERIADIWPGSERAFLIGTALRLARSQRRSAARLEPQGQLDERVRQHCQAESQAITLELLDIVLAKLDRTLVEVFVLFDVEGFSTSEIARALDLPAGTVASRVRRAREEFRAAVARLERVFEREKRGR
jgi:RNA polymerase sigma-70 factor (ECF subfamily)